MMHKKFFLAFFLIHNFSVEINLIKHVLLLLISILPIIVLYILFFN